MYQLTVRSNFDSAHRLEDYDGPCRNLHGHSFLIDVTVESNEINKLGMVMDFKDIKRIIKDYTDMLDHHYVNEVLAIGNATAEFLARWFYQVMKTRFDKPVKLVKITVFESPECGASYEEI